MVELYEEGTHYGEENVSVNICKKSVRKRLFLKSREKINRELALQKKKVFYPQED